MQKPLVLKIIERIADEIGAKLSVEPNSMEAIQIIFKNGRRTFVNIRSFNINKSSSSKMAEDKDYSSFFLKQFGYNVPVGKAFLSESLCKHMGNERDMISGYDYAINLGFPIILKPNNLSRGEMVTKVYSKREYFSTAKKIFAKSQVMLVQKFYSGRDYRIVVLEGKVISAYQRIPLRIKGDGKLSIRELLDEKQKQFFDLNRKIYIDLEDVRIINKLKRQRLSFDSVPEKGQTIYLMDIANLSAGGESVDVTEDIHPDFCNLAVKVTKDMDLKLCGVDIITDDITKPINGQNYIILEINSAPGLSNYALMGEQQMKIVEELYRKILICLENS